jgi:hypothetical protein
MLTSVNATHLVEQTLETIPTIRKLKVDVRCVYNPKEAGSLLKRVIIDQRKF